MSGQPAPAHVVVVGAGIAGTAAALSAAWSGARVTVIDAGAGATALGTGALDLDPWRAASDPQGQGMGAAASLPEAARRVLDALGGYRLPERGSRLLTMAGVVRGAAGHDDALLDVAPLPGGPIAVARCLRPGWDAGALARAWGARFMAIDVRVLRRADERVLPDADFAARHDDEPRLAWLAQRLREALAQAPAGASCAGVVLPPSLGLDHPRAQELSRRVGLPCGEAIALPGGPAGPRFDRARDRALATAGLQRLAARVLSVTSVAAVADAAGDGAAHRPAWRVALAEGDPVEANVVVLAIGGALAGGITYAPPEASLAPGASRDTQGAAARPGPALRASIDAPLTLGAHGRPLETAGSLYSVSPEDAARPFAAGRLLERAGVLIDDDCRCAGAPEGLFAAGDFIADVPRTWLRALQLGVRAGLGAAGVTNAAARAARREEGRRPGSPSRP